MHSVGTNEVDAFPSPSLPSACAPSAAGAEMPQAESAHCLCHLGHLMYPVYTHFSEQQEPSTVLRGSSWPRWAPWIQRSDDGKETRCELVLGMVQSQIGKESGEGTCEATCAVTHEETAEYCEGGPPASAVLAESPPDGHPVSVRWVLLEL